MSRPSVDFLVVGGGPAGCAFALLAARAGASVVLVERSDYRERRPGEHLAGRVRPMLDALGVPRDGAGSVAVESPGVLSIWSGEGSLLKLYRAAGQPVALCVVRHRFDELLCRSARAAGASVVSPGRVLRVERLPSRSWEVTLADSRGETRTEIARALVDATGRHAAIARRQGARRITYGDLIAIVRWLDGGDDLPAAAGAPLAVESGAHGWWSLSVAADRTVVATLYTSRAMMRRARATAEAWWTEALGTAPRTAAIVGTPGRTAATKVYAACPSRSTRTAGDGWIAVGDAAIACDPLAGQGVAVALETAFRAFEAARVDPAWARLGPDYEDALRSRMKRHLEGRARVYEEAAGILSDAFLRSAVMAGATPSGAAGVDDAALLRVP
jgi:flavin-dependent dehydrogenase